MQRDHTVANMQHGSADLQDSLPEARVMTEKHAAGPVKTTTMLPALLYHHALALGPAFPQPEIKIKVRKKRTDYAFWRQFDEKPSIIPGCPGMIKVMIRSPKLRYDMSQDRARYIPDQLMTSLTFACGQCALMMHKLYSPDETTHHSTWCIESAMVLTTAA